MKIQLLEMAMTRNDAMNRCLFLSKKFVEHFDKIFKSPKNQAVEHWCVEMQNWLDEILKIRLKPNSKALSLQCKMDWFFTCGSDSNTLFSDKVEADSYDTFVDKVCVSNNVREAIQFLLQ